MMSADGEMKISDAADELVLCAKLFMYVLARESIFISLPCIYFATGAP
jgi:hypothetical protein